MVDKGPGEGGPKNPMFKCRIFVGNLPTDFLTKPEVVDRFQKYGPVTEVSLHRGFAFVQFKCTEDAQAAIKAEKGEDFKGSQIDCSFAKHERGSNMNKGDQKPRGGNGGGFDDKDGYNKDGYNKDRGERFRDFDRDRDRDRFPSYDRDRPPPFDRDGPLPPPRGPREPRDRSPLRDRYDDDRYRDPYRRDDPLRRDRFYDERRSPPRRDPRDLDPYDRDRLPPPRDDPYRRGDPRDDPYFRDRDRERDFPGRDDPYRRDRDPYDRDRDLFDRDRDRDLYRDRDPLDRRGPPPGPPPPVEPSLDGPIDCEIIVVNKAQRDYAELVRSKVKTILQAGIIYLNSEMGLSTALDDVSRRGVLYAIVLTAQHEVHKSVTVNILHGTPQEHRNMPLDKAIGLIGTNFDRYMQNLREKSGLPPGPAGPAGSSRPPPPISPPQRPPPAATGGSGGGQGSLSGGLGSSSVDLTIPQLLNLLADGKQLTIDELARVIEFLQELRQRMIRDQGGNPAAETKDFGRGTDSLGPKGNTGPGGNTNLTGPGNLGGQRGNTNIGGPRGNTNLGGPRGNTNLGGLTGSLGGPRGNTNPGGPTGSLGGPRGNASLGGPVGAPRGSANLGGPVGGLRGNANLGGPTGGLGGPRGNLSGPGSLGPRGNLGGPGSLGRPGDLRGGATGGGYPGNNGGRKEVDMDLDSDEDNGPSLPTGGPPKPPSQNAQIKANILSMIGHGAGPGDSPGMQAKPMEAVRGMPQGDQGKSAPPLPQGMPPGQPPRPSGPPGGPTGIRALSQQPPPPPPSSAGVRPPRPPGPSAPPVTSGNFNLDNPNVKKALDSLLGSGPNLLRNIGQVSSASAPTPPTASQPTTSQAQPPQPSGHSLTPAQQQLQAQHAQYYQAAAQHNAMLQAHMQAQAAYRGVTPSQQQNYMMMQQQQGGPRYGAPY